MRGRSPASSGKRFANSHARRGNSPAARYPRGRPVRAACADNAGRPRPAPAPVAIGNTPVPLRRDVTQQHAALHRRAALSNLRDFVAIKNGQSMAASVGDVRQDLGFRRLQRVFKRQLLLRRNLVDGEGVHIGRADLARGHAQHPFDFADEVGADNFQPAVPPLLQPLAGEARLDNVGQARLLVRVH